MIQPTPYERVLAEWVAVSLSPTGWLRTFVIDVAPQSLG
jgi:hypothetical protein